MTMSEHADQLVEWVAGVTSVLDGWATECHRAAIEYADRAVAAARAGESGRALAYYVEAFKWERMAAQAWDNGLTPREPTRSVLYRSAASLAVKVGRYRDAVTLASDGLQGDPPDDIRAELDDVLTRAFARALEPNPTEPR